MANQWLRLWHDMPNDPKWRTIARVSKQPISAVIAVYLHILVNASNATERGRTQNLCVEDVASALDMDESAIEAILSAMQGRVMDGERVAGWEKRQPLREDGAAERAKAWRESKKEKGERTQTQPNAGERQDKEEEKELPPNPPSPAGDVGHAGNPASDEANPPVAAKPKRKRMPRMTLKTFVEQCMAQGEKPISDYKPLLEYVEVTRLPMEFVQLCWLKFKSEHMGNGTHAGRLQADWRRHFKKYVENGYYHLWYAKDDAFHLTTVGIQAKKFHTREAA